MEAEGGEGASVIWAGGRSLGGTGGLSVIRVACGQFLQSDLAGIHNPENHSFLKLY